MVAICQLWAARAYGEMGKAVDDLTGSTFLGVVLKTGDPIGGKHGDGHTILLPLP